MKVLNNIESRGMGRKEKPKDHGFFVSFDTRTRTCHSAIHVLVPERLRSQRSSRHFRAEHPGKGDWKGIGADF